MIGWTTGIGIRLTQSLLCLTLALAAGNSGAQTDRRAAPPVESNAAGNVVPSEKLSAPKIESVSPSRAQPGMPLALELSGFSDKAYAGELQVSFDGVPAKVTSQELGYLSVVVPDTLTALNDKPTISVIAIADGKQRASASGLLEIVVPVSEPESTDWQKWVFGAVVLLAMLAAALGYFAGRRPRKRPEQTVRPNAAEPDGPITAFPAPVSEQPASFNLPPPVVPDRLVEAFAQGEAVASLGSGLGVPAGYPPWNRLIMELLGELHKRDLLSDTQTTSMQTVVIGGQEEYAAEALTQALREHPEQMSVALRAVYDRYNVEPTGIHRRLAKLPFAAWLSGGFDAVFEASFDGDTPPVMTPQDAEKALDALSREEPFIFKLYGSAYDDSPVTFGVQQYVDRVRGSAAYEELLDKTFQTRTLFFVGTSLNGIEAFMRGIELRSKPTRSHFVLVVVDDETWELKAQVLRERFGVVVIPVASAQPQQVLEAFLQTLHERVAKASSAREGGGRRGGRRRNVLRGVSVKKIGPFREELSLEFDRHWNLLLGDNGVGKSTILKAIAVALCGEDSAPYAERIVNRDSDSGGEIYLRVGETDADADDSETYPTIIRRRTGGGVRFEAFDRRVMDNERWMALGFPALRTITWERPRSEGSLGARRPTTADVLPILSDEPDPRLDGLKQRIVTLDHARSREQLTGTGNTGHARLMDEFFRIFDTITEGMHVRFKSIDPQTREITIETEDGEIPLEALSQGTISLVSWVGVLLQRLYEITPEGEDPLDRYVIVMIDEIDAHMHPAWQASIVASLSRIFPKAQFIATTHSPLVVRGMDASQVIRFKRNDEGKVETVDVPEDMTMGRADQVLAGTLFDLDADLDEVTQDNIEDYQRLLGKSERTQEEEKEFRRLENVLEFRIPVSLTSAPERRAQELVDALLQEQLGQPFAEVADKIRERASRLFDELHKEHDKMRQRKGGTS